MISPAFNQNCFKVLSLFSLSPGSRFNRKEIQEKVYLYNLPLDGALRRLLSSKILKKEKNYYCLDFENGETKPILELCRKQHRQLRELPLRVYLLLVDLSNSLSLEEIEVFLFGSYAKLIYTEKSDIDLAVLYGKSLKREQIRKLVTKLEKAYGLSIEEHYFDKNKFYRNKKDPLVREILKNGIKLFG